MSLQSYAFVPQMELDERMQISTDTNIRMEDCRVEGKATGRFVKRFCDACSFKEPFSRAEAINRRMK